MNPFKVKLLKYYHFFQSLPKSSKMSLISTLLLVLTLPGLVAYNQYQKRVSSQAENIPLPVSPPILVDLASPTPTSDPNVITSKVYVRAYLSTQYTDNLVYKAKVVVKNKTTGEILGSGLTDTGGKSPQWTVPANTDIEVYLYKPDDYKTQYCGDYWTFNTGPYGNLHSQNMRLKSTDTVPCITESSTPQPTPTTKPLGSPKEAYYTTPASGEIVCLTSQSICKYSQIITLYNNTGQTLYETTLYTQGSNPKIQFQGFDGNWTNNNSVSSEAHVSGKSIQIPITMTLNQQDILNFSRNGKYTDTLFLVGKTCNQDVTPPDCYVYTGYEFKITAAIKPPPSPTRLITTTQSSLPLTPTLTPSQTTLQATPTNTASSPLGQLLPTNTPVPTFSDSTPANQPTITPSPTSSIQTSLVTPTPTRPLASRPAPTKVPPPPLTESAKSVSLTPTADATVDNLQPNRNRGTATQLHVDRWFIKQTAYLKFDLTQLRGWKIDKAALTLTLPERSKATFYLGKTSADWDENKITYNNRPGEFRNMATIKSPQANNRSLPIDLTKQLNEELGKTVTIMITTDSTDGLSFYSRESRINPPTLSLQLKPAPTADLEIFQEIPILTPDATDPGNYYFVRIRTWVVNSGNVPLNNLRFGYLTTHGWYSMQDPAVINYSVEDSLTPNPGYNGLENSVLNNPADTLAVGSIGTAIIDLRVKRLDRDVTIQSLSSVQANYEGKGLFKQVQSPVTIPASP